VLDVAVRVNGRERQRYPLADMMRRPAELVAELSRDMTLEPGDLIACGTSVGSGPIPRGATVEVEISGIGVLSNGVS
jgi:2-keto-4-pentenoate hydratase/2-oxohepta-3-ene-1,7-dioic acid hydratase in catechol pathway